MRLQGIKKGFLLLLLPLLAFTAAHKFYLSVTNVQYSEKDEALQITSRIFIDDFEDILEERYGVHTNLATPLESKTADFHIEKYLRSKMLIWVDGKQIAYKFLGKKYDNDVMVCYLEVPKIKLSKIKTIELQNEVLTDLFEEQQNVLHFKINGNKKSFVLMKDNNKGMLKL
ncbi:DUF6702 family protein [Sediminicola sp. 1XM1-17]|uniref:DUF6702 family protein n=1 Tax=Sediminicola sp. 1XM1-17 TaxID=3127702 RepID=UPI00307740A9